MADPRHRIVVTVDQPTRRRAIIAAAMALLMLAGFALYRVTRATTVSDFEATSSERDRLQAERRQLTRELRAARSEIGDLRDQLAYLNRSRQIDEGACVEVRGSIAALEAESAGLREQLAFYRGIVSPQEAAAGVRVYEMRVTPLKAQPNAYRYELVLIQPARSDKRVGGQVELSFEGLENGGKRRIKLAEVSQEPGRGLLFSFRYFEEFAGELKFPAGFRPLRAIVTVQAAGGKAPPLEEEFEWTKIMQDGGEA